MKLGIAFRGCGRRGVADDLALCTAQKGGSSLWGGREREGERERKWWVEGEREGRELGDCC